MNYKQHTIGMLTLSKQKSLLSTAMSHASWLKKGIGSSCVLMLHISCFTVQSDALALNEMGSENTREDEIHRKMITHHVVK